MQRSCGAGGRGGRTVQSTQKAVKRAHPLYMWHERNINRKHKATGNSMTDVSLFIEALFLLALLPCFMSVKSIHFLTLLRPWEGKIWFLQVMDCFYNLVMLSPKNSQQGMLKSRHRGTAPARTWEDWINGNIVLI